MSDTSGQPLLAWAAAAVPRDPRRSFVLHLDAERGANEVFELIDGARLDGRGHVVMVCAPDTAHGLLREALRIAGDLEMRIDLCCEAASVAPLRVAEALRAAPRRARAVLAAVDLAAPALPDTGGTPRAVAVVPSRATLPSLASALASPGHALRSTGATLIAGQPVPLGDDGEPDPTWLDHAATFSEVRDALAAADPALAAQLVPYPCMLPSPRAEARPLPGAAAAGTALDDEPRIGDDGAPLVACPHACDCAEAPRCPQLLYRAYALHFGLDELAPVPRAEPLGEHLAALPAGAPSEWPGAVEGLLRFWPADEALVTSGSPTADEVLELVEATVVADRAEDLVDVPGLDRALGPACLGYLLSIDQARLIHADALLERDWDEVARELERITRWVDAPAGRPWTGLAARARDATWAALRRELQARPLDAPPADAPVLDLVAPAASAQYRRLRDAAEVFLTALPDGADAAAAVAAPVIEPALAELLARHERADAAAATLLGADDSEWGALRVEVAARQSEALTAIEAALFDAYQALPRRAANVPHPIARGRALLSTLLRLAPEHAVAREELERLAIAQPPARLVRLSVPKAAGLRLPAASVEGEPGAGALQFAVYVDGAVLDVVGDEEAIWGPYVEDRAGFLARVRDDAFHAPGADELPHRSVVLLPSPQQQASGDKPAIGAFFLVERDAVWSAVYVLGLNRTRLAVDVATPVHPA